MEINHYEFEYGEYGNTTGVTINLRGFDILRFNNISKGTAFSVEERIRLKLSGYLPFRVKTLEEQVQNSLDIVAKKENDKETQKFLEWFVREQVEEESTPAKILKKFDAAGEDRARLLKIDKELQARVFNFAEVKPQK